MTIEYRLYPCGTLIDESLFSEYDNQQPYYDDYYQTSVPVDIEGEDNILTYIKTEMTGDN